MMHALYNKKNEKILTVSIIANDSFSALFKNPNFYGVFFFTDANCTVTTDGNEKAIAKQNILFYYPYQKLQFKGNFEGVCIQFHPDFFCIDIHAKDIGCQGLLFNNFMNDTILRCSQIEYDDLCSYYAKIQAELSQKNIGQQDMIASQLKMLLIQAVRYKKGKQKIESARKENIHYQIEKLIDAHFIKESSAEFYAKKIEVSVSTFNRLCKKYFQNSFVTLLNLKRIASAKNKLFLTNNSIKDIAYEVGYNDPLYFSRVFKKHTNISPKEFRKQLKNNRLI
ncbi:AraC family transcriptional regulator [uncultured Kordia sp.]|uniref:helix-turn-helix domain-containing protein n=1 Tax=uncultured Kordia sp. TaxID=507699 RepID=UPI00262A2CA1|nr:helix-turn-helix domain-containing protein [uncultured Kordia sp.]